ncbi:MAG TPA: CHAD domain-containing protein [Terriglobia bacterium]|nr:CHAD domain-containing protein [Terriglobia bacterium]
MSPVKAAHELSPMAPPLLVPAKPPVSHRLPAVFAPAPEAVPDWTRVRKLALRQLNRFAGLEAKVLKGDDRRAVHDLRVSSRRLQQLLDLLFPAPAKDVRRLRRKVRTARRALSEVRNCDVHLERVERALARRRTSQRPTWEAVRGYLLERRAASFEKAVRKLGKANIPGVHRRLKEHLGPRPGGAKHSAPVQPPAVAASPHRAPGAAPWQENARAALARVWRDYAAHIAESLRQPATPDLHAARIATKRLRYLAEVLAALGQPGSAEVLASLRRLQAHLGDWHDLEVFEQMLVGMVARPKFLAAHLETAMAAEKLIVRNRRAKKNYEGRYFAMMLNSVESERLRVWVGSLLAEPLPALPDAG